MKREAVLTSRVYSLFKEDTKKDNPLQDCLFASNVGMTTASSNLVLEDIAQILWY